MVGLKKMPYMLKNGEFDSDRLGQKLLNPVTDRDHWFAEVYRLLVEQIPKANDGTYNHTVAMMAAFVLSRSEMLSDSAGSDGFSFNTCMAAYATAEWALGRRWIDHDEWAASNSLDPDVIAEYQQPNEPNIRAASEWYPGKPGRPPQGAKRNWGAVRLNNQIEERVGTVSGLNQLRK